MYRTEGINLSMHNERRRILLQITLLMNTIQFAIRSTAQHNQFVWPTSSHRRQWMLYKKNSGNSRSNSNIPTKWEKNEEKKKKNEEKNLFASEVIKNFCFRCVDGIVALLECIRIRVEKGIWAAKAVATAVSAPPLTCLSIHSSE